MFWYTEITMQYNVEILAGGFGTRLKELGETKPKGLIQTAESTLVDQLCRAISRLEGVQKVVLVTNDRFYPQYQAWCQENPQHGPAQVINDGATGPDFRLGALGDLELASNFFDRKLPTIVLPSDTYFQFELSVLTALYEQHQAFITAVYHAPKETIANRLGCAVLEGDRIVDFEEKPAEPKSNWACAPFYIYPPEILALLPDYRLSGGSMDTPSSIIPWLLNKNIPVFAATVETAIDVGTENDIQVVKNL